MSRLAALLTALATMVVSMGAGLVAGPEHQQLGAARSGDHDLGQRVSAAVGSGDGLRSLVVAEVTADDIVWAGLGNADDGRRPGSAPTYVRRCPRMSASSRTPPRLTRTNVRPSDAAIDLPRLVLPTPGGPTKHKIGPRPLGFSRRTARNSTIRCLIFSRS